MSELITHFAFLPIGRRYDGRLIVDDDGAECSSAEAAVWLADELSPEPRVGSRRGPLPDRLPGLEANIGQHGGYGGQFEAKIVGLRA